MEGIGSKMNLRNFLATKIYSNKYLHLDYWSILHLILFIIFGTLYPDKWIYVLFGSVIFEVIENNVSKKIMFLKENVKDTINDIFINCIGYWIGMRFF